MSLLTFRAYDLRSAFLEKFGGGAGCPVFTDERAQVKGYHVKVAPCSPQWQRKLESPLGVLLSCVNAHADHNSGSRLTILWKTLTLLEPTQDDSFKEDIVAYLNWSTLTIRSDSLWSINVITGKWKARRHKILVNYVKALIKASPTRIHLQWIKAHVGHEGKERADRLAEEGKNSLGRVWGHSSISRRTGGSGKSCHLRRPSRTHARGFKADLL